MKKSTAPKLAEIFRASGINPPPARKAAAAKLQHRLEAFATPAKGN